MDHFKDINIIGIGGGICHKLYWKNELAFQAKIIVIVLIYADDNTFVQALKSIHKQNIHFSTTALVIRDGGAKDWIYQNKTHLNKDNIVFAESNSGMAWIARNLGYQVIKEQFKKCEWICRIDSDDCLASEDSLLNVVSSIKDTSIKWLLAGNRQSKEGKIQSTPNMPQLQLMDSDYLIGKLEKMANGDSTEELPSCNIWTRADFAVSYPPMESAEDHWLLVHLLLNHRNKGQILSNTVFSVYSISGGITKSNRTKGSYFDSRKALLNYAKWISRDELPMKHEKLVLGWGCEGIAYYIKGIVKKVFYDGSAATSKSHLAWLKNFPKSSFFPSFMIQRENENEVITYPFEQSNICSSSTIIQISDFIVECLEKKIIALNISKKNFRIRNEKLWFIDIGKYVVPFEIHYFKDMCARLYLLFIKGWSDEKLANNTIYLRSSENYLAAINGFETFFSRCINKYIQKLGYFKKPPFKLCPNKYNHKDVTLMIKVCAMEHELISQCLNHILHQMTRFEDYHEIIILVDSRTKNFLREHTRGNLVSVVKQLETFKNENRIQQVLITPQANDEDIIQSTNKKWFGLKSTATRNQEGVPVFPQIWGFDQICTPFLLQMDLDVIIHRGERAYDVIKEMKQAILNNVNVFSAGFNIPQEKDNCITPWYAKIGEFVPEVRFGLLYLERIFLSRPFPNKIVNGRIELSWYRSIEKFQKTNCYRSLRGGRGTTYYLHPSNKYKKNPNLLHRIYDLVEQNIIPDIQRRQWNLIGNLADWKYPERKEKLILILLIDRPDYHWVRALINSIIGQTEKSWGCIVFDHTNDRVFNDWLKDKFIEYANQTSFIRQKNTLEETRNRILEIANQSNSFLIALRCHESLSEPGVLKRINENIRNNYKILALGEYLFNNPLSGLNQKHPIKVVRNSYFQSMNSSTFKKWIQNQLSEGSQKVAGCIINEYCLLSNRKVKKKNLLNRMRNRSYLPNINRIEIDITYACNKGCIGCTRSISQAPENLHMDLHTINSFLERTLEYKKIWERVALLGGEPTLHPRFLEIVEKLDQWFQERSPNTEVKVISNGHGAEVLKRLNSMPRRWLYDNSFKGRSDFYNYFEPFNDAPIDDPNWAREDFSYGCWITQDSGIGLTPFGYFPCAISGGIERIMKFGLGFKEIPTDSFQLLPILNRYCRYCGCFRNDVYKNRTQQQKEKKDPNYISKSWEQAYLKFGDNLES